MKNNIKTDKNLRSVLIIGANGFLGKNLSNLMNRENSLKHNLNLIAADLDNSNITSKIPFHTIDITNDYQTTKKINKISPDIVILTAAMTNVDQCEIEKDRATKINLDGPKNIVKVCKKLGSKLIFMSTDYVFDGTKKKGTYSEKDHPNPLNHYAKTKYQAELSIISSEITYLICRTAVLYGWNKNKLNFITWILKKLEEKEMISIVINQLNSPTFVINLAKILYKLIEKDAEGIFHTTGDDILSRYEMALLCAEIFEYNKELINPIESLKQIAKRPKNLGLDISKLKKLIGSELKIYSLTDGLKFMKNNRI
ncbi:MAG: SDR family oxidoreductase [Promethearchaeota archaeon]